MTLEAAHDVSVNGPGDRAPVRAAPARERSSSIISLGTVQTALRRRRLWVVTGVVGLLLGAALQLVGPDSVEADTTLYLSMPRGANTDLVMETNLGLLRTRAVARLALQDLELDATPDAFRRTFVGTSPGSQVLTITAWGFNEREAVRRADAVAAAFLTFLEQRLDEQTKGTVEALQARLAAVRDDIAQGTAAIDALGTDQQAGALSLQLEMLLIQRRNDIREAAELQSSIDDARLSADEARRGSSVIDRAHPLARSEGKTLVTRSVAGLVAGLTIGVGWVAVQAIVTDRPRRRDDVAAALGVGLGLTTPRVRMPWLPWRLGRSGVTRRAPGPRAMVAEHIIEQISGGASRPARLIVVPLDDSKVAASAVAAAARSLARNGRRVIVADLSERGRLVRLLGRRRESMGAGTSGSVAVIRPSTDPLSAPHPPPPPLVEAGDVDAVLVLAALDPGRGARLLRHWADEAVVLVTAGRASTTTLRSASQMLTEAGITVRSAVLIGADRSDDSLGSWPPPAPLERSVAWSRAGSDL